MPDKKFLFLKTGELFSKIDKWYKYSILPQISHLRGATRIHLTLRRLATLGLEKVENSDNLFERDFDNLIIIDACRHDLFEEVEGKTEYRITKESHSRGFIRKNFSEGDFTDFVVVTANPFFNDEIFNETTGRELYDVFHEVFKTFETKWDEEEKTVKPESVVEDLKTAEKLFPNKRKLVWFMQPHYPFLDKSKIWEDTGFSKKLEGKNSDVWNEAEKGNFQKENIWESYKDNLKYVMPFAVKSAEILSGETILTSDHGNLVGENGLYGHPGDFNLRILRKVPIKHL
jgi:hypothetical protein